MDNLNFNLHRAGVLAPGLKSLHDLQEVCRSLRCIDTSVPLKLPASPRLPVNERRRASQVVRLALACIEQVADGSSFPVGELRSVFATDDGIGETSQQMLEALSTTRQVSPLVFPNSVHGAAAGYFSIAFQNRQSATTVSLGSESFAAGLLCAVTEACALNERILFVSYDSAMTAPMDEVLPISAPTATAWIISSGVVNYQEPVLGSFKMVLKPALTGTPTDFPAWLPSQWASNSSAQGFAALGLLESVPSTSYCLALGEQTLVLELRDRRAP